MQGRELLAQLLGQAQHGFGEAGGAAARSHEPAADALVERGAAFGPGAAGEVGAGAGFQLQHQGRGVHFE